MKVLKPTRLASITLRNAVVVAPMSRMQAEADGSVSPDMPDYYMRYVRDGAGLVMTEAIYADETSGRAYFNQPGLANDTQVDGWSKVVNAVHSIEGRIFAQLQHGGRLAEPGLNSLHLAASDGVAAGNTWQTGHPNIPARAATMAEIEAIVTSFGSAARRARAAGFDGVEIHGARGYLLDDFLSATTNQRTDAFGGSLAARLMMPLAVVRSVRDAIGALPLSFNFSLYKMDNIAYQPPGGRNEVTEIIRALCDAGVDIIHVSTRKALRSEAWGEALFRTVRAAASGDVIANGGLVTLDDCEAALQDGATAVSIARAYLANPDWLARAIDRKEMMRYVPGQERLPLLD